MKRLIFIFSLLLLSSLAFAAAPQKGVLPKIFAGWQLQNSQVHDDPSQADSVNADLLKEDGFKSVETAEYTKPDRKMSV